MWNDPRRADVAEFLGYGPLLPTADGLRAVAPGDLVIDSAGPLEVTVRDVRVRRGYTDLVVSLHGQDALARSENPAEVGATLRARLKPGPIVCEAPGR